MQLAELLPKFAKNTELLKFYAKWVSRIIYAKLSLMEFQVLTSI